MDFLNEEKILEVKMLNKNEYIMIKTSKKFFVVKIDEDKYEIEKIKEIENNKENIENKFFDFNDKIFNIEINSVKNEINAINTLL